LDGDGFKLEHLTNCALETTPRGSQSCSRVVLVVKPTRLSGTSLSARGARATYQDWH